MADIDFEQVAAYLQNLPIENIVYKYQKEYYKAIAVSGGKAGCTPFVEFVLGVIAETLTTQETTRKLPKKLFWKPSPAIPALHGRSWPRLSESHPTA